MSKRTPVYTVDSTDPKAFVEKPETPKNKFPRGYTCLSGPDCRVWIDKEMIGSVQGFTTGHQRKNGETGGHISFIVFDNMEHTKWLGKACQFLCTEFNGSGLEVTIYDAWIKFDDHETFGLSVDDVIMTVTLGYTLMQRNLKDEDNGW